MQNINEVLPLWKGRLEEDKDLVIGLCGPEGVGKSTAAIRIAMDFDKDFTLERNVLYSPDSKEIRKKIVDLPKGSAIIIDEAIKAMLKDEHYSKAQVFLKKVFATARKQNKLIILCMPYFSDFSVYWRKNRIKIWLQVIDRGIVAGFIRDGVNIFSSDPWHLKENDKIITDLMEHKTSGDLNATDRAYVYTRCKTFWKIFSYDNIPPAMDAEYKEKSMKVSGELTLEDEGHGAMVWRTRFAFITRMLIEKNLLSGSEVSQCVGMNPGSLFKCLKEVTGLSFSDVAALRPKGFKQVSVFSKFKAGEPVAESIKNEEGVTIL